jgi:4-amino-4-deoxy-L-arabinose transferase-like glycosyltransferase
MKIDSQEVELMRKKNLVLLFLAATAWRLVFVCLWGPLSYPDSPAYENLAQNLLAGKGYIDTRPFQVMDASMIRTPGYPLFLAAIDALFPGQGMILILIQQILGIMTVGFVYLTGKLLVDEKTGFMAGLFCALHPWLAIFGNIVMTETLFLFLFSLSILILTVGVQKKYPARIILAGLLFGLSALVRPAFLLLPLLLPIAFYVLLKKVGPALRYSALFGISTFIVLLPWIAWNSTHKGYTGLTAFSGINLLTLVQPPPSFYAANDPLQKVLGQCCQNGRAEVTAPIPKEISNNFVFKQVTMPCTYLALKSLREQGYPQPDIDRRFLALATAYIKQNPFAYLRSAGKQMVKLWSGYSLEWLGGKFSKRLEQNRRDGDRLIWIMKVLARIGLGILLTMFTAWGAWRIVQREPSLLILVLIIASIIMTCGFITAADPRYRLPAEPFIILIILCGLRRKPAP